MLTSLPTNKLKNWIGKYAKGVHRENPVCKNWFGYTNGVPINLKDIHGITTTLFQTLTEEQIKVLARSIVDKLVILGNHQIRKELLPKELWDTENYRFLLTITPAIGSDYFDSLSDFQHTDEYKRQLDWYLNHSPN